MNRALRITLIVVALLVGAAALLWTGFFFRQNARGTEGFGHGNMMTRYILGGARGDQVWSGGHMGAGMMGWDSDINGRGRGRVPRGGRGMMDEYSGEGAADPLSVEEAHETVESYLNSYNGKALAVEEIMIFENNAYAIVMEESTGIGAFGLLVDPVTKEAYPEYGPNMMWNLKYGMMRGSGGTGMMGPGMMGGMYGPSPEEFEESGGLSVSLEEALQAAQRYLDEYAPGTVVSDEITPFYGYYTIDVERDGEITGMVSVNGFTSQVFPHTWHGEFIEMQEE